MRSSGSASDLELPELGKAEDSRREAAAGPAPRRADLVGARLAFDFGDTQK